jgi:hypothetical protein
MSYILDALQKNQREQNPEGMSLSLHQGRQRSPAMKWLVAALTLVVVLNGALLAWIMFEPASDSSPTGPAAPTAASNESGQTTAPLPPQRTVSPSNPPEPRPRVRQPAPSVEPAERPVRVPAVRPTQSPAPATVALEDLPQREQTIYNDLQFSTHLFTDVQSECVVRVNGTSLRVGDSFKGLTLTRVTEMGAVFAERRDGKLRHVEVPVVERLGE